MAIERKKPIAFDDPADEMGEGVPAGVPDEGAELAAAPATPEGGETVTIDLGMLGGQKVAPGDIVRLEVVSASDEDGTAVLKYSTPKTGGAIAKASAAFNEGP